MLTVYATAGGDAAKAYFFTGLVHGDYYTEGQERAGHWWGEGAKLLNLFGRVRTRDFCRLVDNQHPETQERLTLRNDGDRRAGYDLTFSPCKSFSLAALLLKDERLLQALRESVEVALVEAESLIQTRVRKGGRVAARDTHNLTAAIFEHLTARPEGGQLPDPQAHIHAYLMNATFDVEEHVWKAVEPIEIKVNRSYLEAVFENELARRVQRLGYEIVKSATGWEIKGVPAEAIAKFSKRSERIKVYQESKGIDDPAEKAKSAAKTRRGKAPEHTLDELRDGWWSQLSGEATSKLRAVGSSLKPHVPMSAAQVTTESQKIVDSVAATIFERSSTVTERQFITQCLHQSRGKVQTADLRSALEASSLEVRDYRGARRVTHPEAYREERQIVSRVTRSIGSCKPLLNDSTAPDGLTRDQSRAYRYITSSRNRFMVIEGRPGTGKTTLTHSAAAAVNGKLRELLSPVLGEKVVVIAPTTIASRVVLRESGFKDADTIAKFLADKTLQDKARGGWVWVDEASQIGTTEGRRLIDLLDDLKCRAVFSGDRKQTRSVSRGSLLDLMIDEAGCRSQVMEQVVRQTGRMKEIVSTFISGNLKQGLAALDNDGHIHILPQGECQSAAAEEYVRRSKEGEKVALITPTHKGAEETTACVRAKLRAAGKLGADHSFRTWRDTNLTAEQRGDQSNYRPGQMVRINTRVPGLEFGKQYEVVSVAPLPFYGFRG